MKLPLISSAYPSLSGFSGPKGRIQALKRTEAVNSAVHQHAEGNLTDSFPARSR